MQKGVMAGPSVGGYFEQGVMSATEWKSINGREEESKSQGTLETNTGSTSNVAVVADPVRVGCGRTWGCAFGTGDYVGCRNIGMMTADSFYFT